MCGRPFSKYHWVTSISIRTLLQSRGFIGEFVCKTELSVLFFSLFFFRNQPLMKTRRPWGFLKPFLKLLKYMLNINNFTYQQMIGAAFLINILIIDLRTGSYYTTQAVCYLYVVMNSENMVNHVLASMVKFKCSNDSVLLIQFNSRVLYHQGNKLYVCQGSTYIIMNFTWQNKPIQDDDRTGST